ncbi:MAG: MFS transporter [bacterium]
MDDTETGEIRGTGVQGTEVDTIPRNFWLGVANGVLFLGSNALLDPALVIAPFIFAFTGNRILVGLVQAIAIVGWHWPQAVLPGLVEHKERKLPIYLLSVITRGGSLTTLVVVVTFFLDSVSFEAGVVLFFLFYAAFVSSCGIAGIPFFDIVAKSIAPNRRGIFFGIRRVFGGMLAAGMGSLLYAILSRPQEFPFPKNYTLVFLIADGLMLVAVTFFLFVREPIHPVRSSRLGFRGFVRSGIQSLRDDQAFRRMILFRIFLALAMVPIPFLTPCALEILGAKQAISGTFVTITMITAIAANLVWAPMNDRYGTRIILLFAALFCVLMSVLALGSLLIHRIPEYDEGWPLLIMTAAVVGSSLVNTAFMMGAINYLLEIAPARSRPTYIGICQLVLLPTALFPVMGGVLATVLSYEAVFLVALAAALSLFLVVRKLPEPRRIGHRGSAG